MIIERASVSDSEAILSLQKIAYRSEAEIYGDDRIEPLVQTLEQLRQQFEDHLVLKAVADGVIIGSVRAREQGGTCYIGKLMVHPGYQNKGIGKRLMDRLEGCFPQARFELFTGSKSVKNIAFYEKLGYRAFKEHAVTPELSLVYLEKNRF